MPASKKAKSRRTGKDNAVHYLRDESQEPVNAEDLPELPTGWTDEVYDHEAEGDFVQIPESFDEGQSQRLEALSMARTILGADADQVQLIALAEYIIDGSI